MKFELINDDIFEAIKKIKDGSVNLFIIDPPYGRNYDDWDKSPQEFSKFTEQWIKLCVKKLHKNGVMWIFMDRKHLFTSKSFSYPGLVNILEKYGLVDLEKWVTWKRMKGRASNKRPKSLAEEIIHFSLSEKTTWNNLVMKKEVVAPYMLNGRPRGWFTDENSGKRFRWTGLGNVWLYSSPVWSGKLDVQRHSAQKPLLLIQRLVLLCSNKGDLVVDPFMGSGVTGIVCKYHDRDFIGIEKDKKIFNETKNYLNIKYNEVKEILDNDVQKIKGEKDGSVKSKTV